MSPQTCWSRKVPC